MPESAERRQLVLRCRAALVSELSLDRGELHQHGDLKKHIASAARAVLRACSPAETAELEKGNLPAWFGEEGKLFSFFENITPRVPEYKEPGGTELPTY